MTATGFRDLAVWQKAHCFVLDTYKLTRGFPKEELFVLTAQFRRAAISIPANIAEGFRKTGKFDKARFYNTAQGSLEECRYYLILSHDLGYADTLHLQERLDEIGRMLDAYTRAIREDAQ
jgi:four helix bundle protein